MSDPRFPDPICHDQREKEDRSKKGEARCRIQERRHKCHTREKDENGEPQRRFAKKKQDIPSAMMILVRRVSVTAVRWTGYHRSVI